MGWMRGLGRMEHQTRWRNGTDEEFVFWNDRTLKSWLCGNAARQNAALST
jgi:hypothetical protein